ncbi:MAG: 30S ribosomal protein S15 [bacterium]
MLSSEEKKKLIEKNRINEDDTGSSEVQITLLSTEIKKLLLHLKKNPKDLHSKRGLLKMVARRRKLLKYLKNEDEKRYEKIIKEMGLKQ